MEDWGTFYYRRPLVFAHRGASGSAPENTMAAFEAARAAGADGIELDVTCCASGEVVVIHDDTVDRTTNGSGAVATMPLATLRALDAGSWFGPQFAGERVPLLAEVLDALGGVLRINIEIKAHTVHSGGIEGEVAALVRARGLRESVLISSFSLTCLRRMQAAAPELQRGLLLAPRAGMPLAWAWARRVAADALHPAAAGIDDGWVRRAAERGYRVNVWTVNDPAEMRRMVAAGVDGIITDCPERFASEKCGEQEENDKSGTLRSG